MSLTANDRERIAFINGDTQTLELIDTIELERDDAPIDSAAIKVHEEGWETNAWCLARVVDALQAAAPLKKTQMRLLATELQGLVERLPTKGPQEHAFRARIDRICRLQD